MAFRYISRITVVGNVSRAAALDGFLLTDVTYSTFVGNVCSDNGRDDFENEREGIMFSLNCDYNIIADNICTGNKGYGINITSATCDKNLIHGNMCLGNTVGAIADSGTNTTVVDNVIA